MPIRRKNKPALDDLPGLFDTIDITLDGASDPYSEIIATHRTGQKTPERNMAREYAIDPASLVPHRELQYMSFGSGSSGNCAYVGIKNEGGIIIDAGVDAENVLKELKRNSIPADKIAGIILTHDHTDHVRYAYKLLRAVPSMRLYCTPRIINGILRRHSISGRIKDRHTPIFKEFEFAAGPLVITPFEVSHDGSDNVGFHIRAAEKTFVVVTDTGYITERADHYIRKANYLMIEANYDRVMLDTGPYPYYLRARIASATGHMDNKDTAAYLAEIYTEALTDVYLCHLSHDNNTPATAFDTIAAALAARGITVADASGSVESRAASLRLYALPRHDPSPLFVHRL